MKVIAALKVLCITFIFTALYNHSLYSQSVIRGIVVNQDNKPLREVFVNWVENPTHYTFTDKNGKFEITTAAQHTHLSFSLISYKTEIINTEKENLKELKIILTEQSIILDEVVVSSEKSLTSSSIWNAIREQKVVPGGTVVTLLTPERQRLETIKDALAFVPGVMIQETFGANDLPRLNIRGSGIQSNPQRRGVYLSIDGIPINFADGSYLMGPMDAATTHFVEAMKGANALKYGAATLGGAINFVSHTGLTSPGVYIKAGYGSQQYYSLTARHGFSKDKWDNNISISLSQQEGFRQHNKNKHANLSINTGYRFSNDIETRFYVTHSHTYFQIPGPLTLKALQEDPTQINRGIQLPISMGPNVMRDKPMRQVNLFRIANRTAIRLSSSSGITTSLSYQYADDRFVFPIVLSTQHSYNHDLGIKTEWYKNFDNHAIKFGLLGSYGFMNRRGHINKNGKDSFMFSKDFLYAFNAAIYGEEDWSITDHWHLIANLHLVYNIRNSKDVFPLPELRPWYSHSSHKYRYFHSENTSLRQDFHAINPRIGTLYHVDSKKEIQLFANISKSYEPPTFHELTGTEVTNNINTSPKKLFAVKLKKQQALTVELGSRANRSRYGWNISIYHSWIKDELLEVKDFVLGIKNTRNYPSTLHAGIELGGNIVPIKDILSKGKDKINIKGVWNYSDFRFSSGEYKGNRLAGIPVHFVELAAEYSYAGKGFIELNTEWQPRATYVDHSNTLQQPSYAIYGFKLGYSGLKNVTFQFEGKNIFNSYYASSYIISDQIHNPPIPFPKFSAENIAFFIPGPTRSFYVGITYKY